MRVAGWIAIGMTLAAMGCGQRAQVEAPTEPEAPQTVVEEAVVHEETEPEESPATLAFAEDWAVLDRLEPTATAEEWARLLADAKADPFLMLALLRRWAAVDPERCWKGLVELSGGGELVGSHVRTVVREWAASAPEQAIDALLKWDGDGVDYRLGSVLEIALNTDFERGEKLLAKLIREGAQLGNSYSPSPWMESDPSRACSLLAALPRSHYAQYSTATTAASIAWYREDAKAALAWSLGLWRGLRRPVVEGLALEMSEKGDAEWLVKLHNALGGQVERERVRQMLSRHLLQKDLAEACQWALENTEGAELVGCFNSAMSFIERPGDGRNVMEGGIKADLSPEIFLPFFQQMSEGRGKGENALTLFQKWSKLDPARASEWMAKLHPRSYYYVGQEAAARWSSMPEARPWLSRAPDSAFMEDTLKMVLRPMSAEEVRGFTSTLSKARAEAARKIWEKWVNDR